MANWVVPYTANAIINDRLKGLGSEPNKAGWGTGAGTMTRDRTTLFEEDSGGSPAYARVTCTTSIETVAQTGDTFVMAATMTANADKSITCWGVFDAAEGGRPFLLVDFSPIPIAAGKQIAFVGRVQGL
jgi:hypothetical protein